MKKIIILLVLFVCFGTIGLTPSLFADQVDLTKFPSFMTDKDWILNLGLGLNNIDNLGRKNHIWVPPLRLSFDRNVAMGELGLPFFFGGLVSYSGIGYKDPNINWYYGTIGLGFRCGYHFDWKVDNLDTYAVGTTGWAIHTGDTDFTPGSRVGHPLFGVHIGVRYFLNSFFGFWAESGWNGISWLDFGFTFKF
ncbi:MAG: hypothetical protein FWD14_07555 [Treponema sp.]|nr:hypothetical protein [Treponema sp.]